MTANLYNNKYRIESSRLKNWDYGRNASYFVTICTRNREHFFGEISGGEMKLSEMGHEAKKYWQEIPNHFPFVILDEFIVMPNHVHGIVIIDKPDDDDGDSMGAQFIAPSMEGDAMNRVSTAVNVGDGQNRQRGGITGNYNPMIQENLSRTLRWYKGRVTFESRKIHADFSWQGRFHDHIIGDEGEFERIKNYIITNPSNWAEDKFYSK